MLSHGLFRRFGFDVIRWPVGTSYTSELRRLLEGTQPDIVVDVGGNRGEFVRGVRAAGFAGDIISFEPVVATAAILAEQARSDPRWSVEVHAVGDREEQRVLRIPRSDNDDLASFLEPTPRGLGHFPVLADTRAEQVSVRRLDNVLAGRNGRIFLKVDTQGWDMRVLEGAVGILEQVVALQIELAVAPLL